MSSVSTTSNYKMIPTAAKAAGKSGGKEALMNVYNGINDEVANIIISLILIVLVGVVAVITVFFWRKIKSFSSNSLESYQYSRLRDRENEDDLFEEAVEELGTTLSNYTSDEEIEPATLPVSASLCTGPHLPTANVATRTTVLMEDSDEELLQ